MGFLDKLFGNRRPPAVSDEGLQLLVRCDRCQALIRLRIDGRNDLSLNDEGDGYFVRKTLVDDRCFRRIELEMTFDLARRPTGHSIANGTLLPADQSEQEDS
ncbi:MAG TPA: hypothetical protein VGE07_20700 [Herpetosiphonaceae bacterium]